MYEEVCIELGLSKLCLFEIIETYDIDIPNAIRVQYDNIIVARKGFDGQIRDVGDGIYIVTGLVCEAQFKTRGVNNSTAEKVHIIHCNAFFDGISERPSESALSIFDCRNCGNGKDGI